jgi:hypothetical protein
MAIPPNGRLGYMTSPRGGVSQVAVAAKGSSFSQVVLGAPYGASLGLQPHGRHSAPTRRLVGPLSRVDAPRVDLASSTFQQTRSRWRALSCQRTRVAPARRGFRFYNQPDAISRQLAGPSRVDACRIGTAAPSSRERSSLALTVLRVGKPSGAFARILTPAMYMPTVCSMYITAPSSLRTTVAIELHGWGTCQC